jgi:uncharacterized SAM-binding protein YcdF (DUF218 family)
MDFLADFAKALLLPPASLYLVGVLGWLLVRRRPTLGRTLLALSGGLLIALSLPVVAEPFHDGLSRYPPLDVSRPAAPASAIVVLGGEATWAGEYGGDTLGAHSLARLRYGARLHRRLGLPILVTGGPPDRGRRSVAELMAEALTDDFGVAARWSEPKARNTYENALYAADILRAEGIATVYLVTDAVHMGRATAAFEAQSLGVVPAPVGVPPADPERGYRDFVPSAHALATSAAAVYEHLGQIWYFVLGRSAAR